METITNWIKLNPHIVTIILLIILLIVVIKLVKKILVTGLIIFIMLGVFVFNGSIFPSAEEARDIINKISDKGKNYVQSKEYQEDLQFIKDKYPDLVDMVEEKTKEILGQWLKVGRRIKFSTNFFLLNIRKFTYIIKYQDKGVKIMYKHLSSPEKYILRGIPILFVLGTLMHFAYDFFNKSVIVGLFAAVNESVWEHTKMVLLPVILYWILYYYIKGRKYSIDKNKWFQGALISLITSIISIPILYYFYTEAFGVEVMVIDILILLMANIFGQLLGLHVYKHGKGINAMTVINIFLVIILMYMVFTIYPPHIPLFQDGPSGKYGMWKNFLN